MIHILCIIFIGLPCLWLIAYTNERWYDAKLKQFEKDCDKIIKQHKI